MNREDDWAYLRRRAEQERICADATSDPSVARIHRVMASEYERRLDRSPSELRGDQVPRILAPIGGR